MRTTLIAMGVLAPLFLAACSDAGDPEKEPPTPPADDQGAAAPAGDATSRAREALGEAGQAARETLQNVGEAGRAGVEALQENAPAIRENLNEAGERVRDAAGALTGDGAPAANDAQGDSEADPNETPERQEGTGQ